MYSCKDAIMTLDAFVEPTRKSCEKERLAKLRSIGCALLITLLSCIFSQVSECSTRQELEDRITTLKTVVSKLQADQPAAFSRIRASVNPGQGVLLVVSTATVSAGASVDLAVNMVPGTNPTAGVQGDIIPPPGLTLVSVSLGKAALDAGKQIATNVIGGNTRFLVFGFNQTVMNQGPVAVMRFSVPGATPRQFIPISIINPAATDPNGNGLLAATVSGTLGVK